MLLVLPLALQHDPGLQTPPGLGPVLPAVSLVLAGPEIALAQSAHQAEKLPPELELIKYQGKERLPVWNKNIRKFPYLNLESPS